MRPRRRTGAAVRQGVIAGLMLLVAAEAGAQTAWTGRVRVGANAGVQAATDGLSESIALTKFVEPAPVTADAPSRNLPLVEGDVSIRLFGNVGAQMAVSYLSSQSDADVTAEIPHPFFFNQPRAIDGQAPDMRRAERALHTDVAYMIVLPRVDVSLFGGASFVHVTQDFVTDVIYAQIYPFDTARFVSATATRGSASKTGYNMGADVTWKLGREWGLGGLFRFTRAQVPFTVNDLDVGEVRAGGLQAGGGLRLFF